MPRRLLALTVAIAALLLVPGCGHRRDRVVVLGIDGIDPRVVDLLAREGQLPAFSRLRAEGAWGPLEASLPLASPVLWTTMATGRTPDEHGITSFKVAKAEAGGGEPVTSTQRRVKALWNLASEAGRRVAVVGWWATWPVEPVNGALVSDRTCYHFLFADGQQGRSAVRDTVFPPELTPRVEAMIRRPSDIGSEEAADYISVPAEELERPFDFADDVSHFRWALATADSYARIGRELWRTEDPDLLMLYIEGTDSVSHLFGHLFRAEGLHGELAAQQARYGRAVEAMYVWADRLLGQAMADAGPDTTVVVLSDHGFKLGMLHSDPSVTRDMRRVSIQAHDPLGIVGLWGRGVKRGATIVGAHQLDVAPTLLALLGLAAAEDMPGNVLEQALEGVKVPARVTTYETPGQPRAAPAAAGGPVDAEVLAHLDALGYLGGEDAPEAAPALRQADVDVLLTAGRYDEAVEAYRLLIDASPDDPALHLNIGYALEHLDRLDEALAALDRALELDPDLALAHLNRGAVLERLGRKDQAVAAYRAAAHLDGSLTAARTALARLTGSALVYAPATPEQRRAAALAAQASAAARVGDYPRALALLEEAEGLWPDCPMVFQYRANVDYLMGDLPAAVKALERAAALEPDNVAVRTNLERLRRKLEESGR